MSVRVVGVAFRRRTGRSRVEGLDRGERVLATADGPGGAIAATNRRLVLPGLSIGWEKVERASWDGDEETLVVIETAEAAASAGRGGRHRIPVTEPGRLVDIVREQVTGSVVIVRQVAIAAGRGVRVTGRRRYDGELVWSAVVDAGLDLEDPPTKARLDAAVAVVRAEVETG